MRAILALAIATTSLAGCRQLLGLDDPSMRVDATMPDTKPVDASADGLRGDGPADALAMVGYVQGKTSIATGGSSVSLTFGDTQIAGDLDLVVIAWNGSGLVSSVTDTAGNSYAPASAVVSSSLRSQIVYYAPAIAASHDTVTVMFTSSVALPELRIAEYHGLTQLGPLDATAANTGSGTALDSTTASTLHGHDLLIGLNAANGTHIMPGQSYTVRLDAAGDAIEDREVMVQGTYDATCIENVSGPWIMQLIAFAAAD